MKKQYFNEQLMMNIWSRGHIENKLWNGNHLPYKEQVLFWKQILDLIRGIIFTHRLQRFAPVEDCIAYATEAIIQALGRYDPNKILSSGKHPSLFNYLSLTAKRSIQFSTIKEKKHDVLSYDFSIENGYDHPSYDYTYDYDTLLVLLKDIVNTFTHNNARNECLELTDLLVDFMKLGYNNPTKRMFLKYTRSKSPLIQPNRMRQFFNLLRENKNVLEE